MDPEPSRWTSATEHPDMWVDPADDPRESGPRPEGELATLRRVLADYRSTLLMKCSGLTPAQLARCSVPPSTMSLLGLLRHLVEVERDWQTWLHPDEPTRRRYGSAGSDFAAVRPDPELVQAALADLAHEQTVTDELLLARSDLGERLPSGVSVRELWVHRVEEYARHCGHADLLRECVDGRVGQ